MLDQVLNRLDAIVAHEQQRNSALGYFPALYRRMTQAVADGIVAGRFEDPVRMEQLDIRFAQRYFDAYDAFSQQKSPSAAWNAAFWASADDDLIVLQHLILGINAHINLDLSIAAAETAPGNAIWGLEKDFAEINRIIAELTDEVEAQLAQIWLPFGWLDVLLRTRDEGWINFSISTARKASWEAAKQIAVLDGQPKQLFINTLDAGVAFLAQRITAPGFWVKQGIRIVRRCEKGTVAEKIGVLRVV
jgi:Family of unknown function (DUF5995)